jgi:hypothetical protein
VAEFTDCPGQCDAKVKVHDGNMVNFCCHNCWRWHWESGVMNTVPYTNYGAFLPRHSEQCEKRQMSRVHEPVVGGEFTLVVRDTDPSEDRK